MNVVTYGAMAFELIYDEARNVDVFTELGNLALHEFGDSGALIFQERLFVERLVRFKVGALSFCHFLNPDILRPALRDVRRDICRQGLEIFRPRHEVGFAINLD